MANRSHGKTKQLFYSLPRCRPGRGRRGARAEGKGEEQPPSTEGPGEGRDNGGRKKEGKNYGGGKEKTQDDSAVPSAGDR